MSKRKKWIIASFAAVLVIAAVIFFFSSQNASESSNASGGFTAMLLSIFKPGFREMTARERYRLIRRFGRVIRKLAHFSEYLLLGASLLTFFRLRFPKWSHVKRAAVSWCVATLYAGTDELHQMFVDGRGPGLMDVGIDSAGALTGVLIALVCVDRFLAYRKKTRKSRTSEPA